MTPHDLYAAGIAVIPIAFATKTPLVRWFPYQTKQPTPADVQRWFTPGKLTNAAAVCGWRDLVVLDFDTILGYGEWLLWAARRGEFAAQAATTSYRVESAKGIHVYLYVDDTPRCSKMWRSTQDRENFHKAKSAGDMTPMERWPGYWGDIKGRGGYVLIPPSVHPTGVPYMAVNPGAPIVRVPTLADVLPDPPQLRQPVTPITLRTVVDTTSLFPETKIERIRRLIPITSLFPNATGRGRWRMTMCPWHSHQSNRESLRLDTQDNVVFCFSGCTPHPWDVPTCYARLRNVDLKTAIRELSAQIT